jgi:hypothetical protein
MISNTNSSICFSGFTNMTGTFPTVISETRGTTTVTAPNTAFPARGGTYSSNFFVPLYLSGQRPSSSFGLFTSAEDIGSVGATGTSTSYSGKYFIDGSGADIYGTSDAFQFINTSSSGAATLSARINSLDNTNANAKSGVMFRDSTNANGMFVDVVMLAGGGARMEARSSVGGSAVNVAINSTLTLPCYVELVRSASNTYTGYTSPDGSTWTTFGTVTVTLPATAQAGLCVTSHSTGVISRSIIDNVYLSGVTQKFEAELQTVPSYSGPDWRVFSDTLCSGGEGSILDANAVGNNFVFTIPAITKGNYDVRIGVKKFNSRGIAQAALGTPGNLSPSGLGAPQDFYSSAAAYPEIDLGTWAPASSSDKWLWFTVTGKNASSSGYSVAIDYIKFVAQ